MAALGRLVLIAGFILLLFGGAMVLLGDRPFPGNFVWRRGGVTFYFPLGLSLLLSIVLTILLNVIFRAR
jgi:hypothetical protein